MGCSSHIRKYEWDNECLAIHEVILILTYEFAPNPLKIFLLFNKVSMYYHYIYMYKFMKHYHRHWAGR
jgi:hypothetical protein